MTAERSAPVVPPPPDAGRGVNETATAVASKGDVRRSADPVTPGAAAARRHEEVGQ